MNRTAGAIADDSTPPVSFFPRFFFLVELLTLAQLTDFIFFPLGGRSRQPHCRRPPPPSGHRRQHDSGLPFTIFFNVELQGHAVELSGHSDEHLHLFRELEPPPDSFPPPLLDAGQLPVSNSLREPPQRAPRVSLSVLCFSSS